MELANRRIWDRLSKTDPQHTKGFQRSGGFKGTAIKPIWCDLQMTETFGPCGTGWGMTEPRFETHMASDEGLVFCTVGLWYMDAGKRSETVYGVGGDKFLVKIKDSVRANDEAFKSAYTDALGNAMKHIGVAADIHMGLFDDSKYLNDVAREFSKADKKSTVGATTEYATDADFAVVCSTAKENGWSKEDLKSVLSRLGIKSAKQIPEQQLPRLMGWARKEEEIPHA